jgi:hypothetical protein
MCALCRTVAHDPKPGFQDDESERSDRVESCLLRPVIGNRTGDPRTNITTPLRAAPARVFIPSRARGTDTLVRREPRISTEIPSSDVQNWVRTPRADRKRHAMCPRGRGRFVQTTENPAGSPGAARGRVLLCKLTAKTCPQITVNGPVSVSSILDDAATPFFYKPQMRRGLARAQHAVPTPASTAPSRARGATHGDGGWPGRWCKWRGGHR